MVVDGMSLGGMSILPQTQDSNKAERAEGFAQELSRAQKNTLEDPVYQQRLKRACQGFESMFMQMMWKEMRGTVPENTLFGESQGEKIFRDMLDTEMVDRMTQAGGVGLAELMYNQLTEQYQAQRDMDARNRAALEARGIHIDLQR